LKPDAPAPARILEDGETLPSAPVRQREIAVSLEPHALCRELRADQETTLYLDGSGGHGESWSVGPLLAAGPRLSAFGHDAASALVELDTRIARRRRVGGSADTGIAVLAAYDLLAPPSVEAAPPRLIFVEVDRSLRYTEPDRVLVTVRGASDDAALESLCRSAQRGLARTPRAAARTVGQPRTSLPRERYLRAVEEVRRNIALGEVYQANLCQRFEAAYRGDPFELFAGSTTRSPAPRSAFLESGSLALVSASPETFLRVSPDGKVETWPIKGTRPRGATPEEDRRSAAELLASEKDRAELVMIVDLERNDLGRVCRTGTVRVPELTGLRSFPAVHHLVAHVEGWLRPGTSPSELLRATFPGGSITGAPKLRAMQLLAELEPVARSYFSGSLFWFGDDGSLDSSILIRSAVLWQGRVWLGAGGGVVTDSDPEQEWLESNHKARALARELGFDPEEAR